MARKQFIYALFEYDDAVDSDKFVVLSHWKTRAGAEHGQREYEKQRDDMAALGFTSSRRWVVAALEVCL